jgi:hypothetical protein
MRKKILALAAAVAIGAATMTTGAMAFGGGHSSGGGFQGGGIGGGHFSGGGAHFSGVAPGGHSMGMDGSTHFGGMARGGGPHGLAAGRSDFGGRGATMGQGGFGHGFRGHHFRRGFGYGGLYGWGGDWWPDYDYAYCSYYDPYGNCYAYGW